MESLRQYILSIIAAAMILGILKSICGENKLLKLAGGIFLTLVVLQPMVRFDFSDMTEYFSEFSETGSMIAARGEAESELACQSIIKQRLEAYILDKAASMGAGIQASVELDCDNIPIAVRIQGALPAPVKAQLEQMLESELGIAKENQLWIG